MEIKYGFRPGNKNYYVAHRGWRKPDEQLKKDYNIDTRHIHCWRCFRPVKHPIHWKVFRQNRDWRGWQRLTKIIKEVENQAQEEMKKLSNEYSSM